MLATSSVGQPAKVTAMMSAIDERARRASEARGGSEPLLCLLGYDGSAELWDVASDRRLAAQSITDAEDIVATSSGCAVRAGRTLRFFERQGAVREIAVPAEPTALAWSDGALLVAAGPQGLVLDAGGAEKGRYQTGVGVTAVAVVSLERAGASRRYIVAGYRDGNVELTPLDAAEARPTTRFEQTTSSPVTRIVAGLRGTIMAGHGDGSVGLLDMENGAVLRHAQLHGPVIHLLVEDGVAYAATSLGPDLVWELSAFGADWCQLLEQVWQQVPVVWQDGRIVETGRPEGHACRRK